jgi:hypothetical protein
MLDLSLDEAMEIASILLGFRPLPPTPTSPPPPDPVPTPVTTSPPAPERCLGLLVTVEVARDIVALTSLLNPKSKRAKSLLALTDEIEKILNLTDGERDEIYRSAKITIENPGEILTSITLS